MATDRALDPVRRVDHGAAMPDIAHEVKSRLRGAIDRVGMTEIEVPVRLRDAQGREIVSPAKAEAFVSLDDQDARGIHMSRLFLSLQAILAEEVLSLGTVRRILQAFLGSHQGLSSTAAVRLDFEMILERPALVSANRGWRSYPVSLGGTVQDGEVRFQLGAKVAYSSTCPCSAALARQLIQQRFAQDFTGRAQLSADEVAAWLGREESIAATPHSQRSYAYLDVVVADENGPSLVELIDHAEGVLKTAVQAAVKREDEQEFARLNGANLMFCEDAGRRLKHALDLDLRIIDYRVEAVHVESLHPHNAVSVVVKGVPGGMGA